MADKPKQDRSVTELSRRAFIKGAGAAAAVAVGIAAANASPSGADANGSQAVDAANEGVAERLGPNATPIELRINGVSRKLTVEPRDTLLEVLRDRLGLYGTKLVCDRGACGACTVHLDGRPVTSCMVLAPDARGHEIVTIEGLGGPGAMHPVQAAFVANDALQCGFCTPGMIMSIAAALERNPAAGIDEIKHAVSGNLCRCGTYPHVFKAALAVAARAAEKPSKGKA
ncbi:MAG TPA: (2Fe-2S)-binding protein [Candidatus Binataceae bacterium]|nr:(2Fe-2S)-binding protein [Candidatus Binataceae bacterium]